MPIIDDNDIDESNVSILYCSYNGLWDEGATYPGIKLVLRDGRGNEIDTEIINSGVHLADLDDAEETMKDIVGEQIRQGWYCYIIMSRFYQTMSSEIRENVRKMLATKNIPIKPLLSRVGPMQLVSTDPERWINLN